MFVGGDLIWHTGERLALSYAAGALIHKPDGSAQTVEGHHLSPFYAQTGSLSTLAAPSLTDNDGKLDRLHAEFAPGYRDEAQSSSQ